MIIPGVSKLTWAFLDGQYGWTESWYVASTPSAATAYALLQGYLDVRMPMMGVGIVANYARCTYLDGTGVSFKIFPNNITMPGNRAPQNSQGTLLLGYTPKISADATPPDRPYSTLMYSFFNASGQQKLIYLSGCPDDVIVDPLGPVLGGLFLNAQFGWTRYIQQSSFGWLGRRGAGAQTKHAITAVSAGPPGTVTTVDGTFAAGSLVQVGGFRNLRGYRGQFYVVSQAGQVVTLQGYSPPAALPVGARGYLQSVAPLFQQAASYSGPREVGHKRGKGLLSPVGRRRARHL